MGWTSWNTLGCFASQADMEAQIDALGTNGLHDYGYNRASLDDCWQACGAGVNGSFHDADGAPIVDEQIVVSRHLANSVRIYRRSDVQTLSCSPYCESSFKNEAETTSEAEMRRYSE